MRFHTPEGGILRVDRVGGLHTYAARIDGGTWTAWGEVRTVVVAATGHGPADPWVDRVVAFCEERAALPDVPGEHGRVPADGHRAPTHP
ncbi:hypothetical protein [Patulibacter sp.]|uniref:hypothetical protein n=1 Tax=Patulibacter sp. TaxID=1912859 RepID=UPI002723F4E5|nr:hypothetical protein [Patulibacter sp.]MDO9410564.1 hypothetical protein [Patulibacter sp.]